MRKLETRRLFPAAAALLLALCGCARGPEVAVEEARLILPVLPGRPAALYFIATSRSGSGHLTSIASSRAGRIELHETRTENGVSRMVPLGSVGFDDISRIDFEPGRRHAMVHGLDPSIKAGDKLPLTFAFSPGPRLTVEADVLKFGQGHGER